jgi:hypothetical protein
MEAAITTCERNFRVSNKNEEPARKVTRIMAVAFSVTAIVLIIAGAIFLGRSNNPIFPFSLSLILTSISLGLLAQALRSPPLLAVAAEQDG